MGAEGDRQLGIDPHPLPIHAGTAMDGGHVPVKGHRGSPIGHPRKPRGKPQVVKLVAEGKRKLGGGILPVLHKKQMAAAFARQHTPPLGGIGGQLLGNSGSGDIGHPGSGIDACFGQGEGIAEGKVAVQSAESRLGGVRCVAASSLAAGGVEILHVGNRLIPLSPRLTDYPQIHVKLSLLHLHADLGTVSACSSATGRGHTLHLNSLGEGNLPLQDGQRDGLYGSSGVHGEGGGGLGGGKGELHRHLPAAVHQPQGGGSLGDHDLSLGADHPHLPVGRREDHVILEGKRLPHAPEEPPHGGLGGQGLYRGVALTCPCLQRAFTVGSHPRLDLAADVQPSGRQHPPHRHLRGQIAKADHGLPHRQSPSVGLALGLQAVLRGQRRAVHPAVLPHVENVVIHPPCQIGTPVPGKAIGREQIHPNAQKPLDLGLVVGQGKVPRHLGGKLPRRKGDLHRPAPRRVSHVFVHHKPCLL